VFINVSYIGVPAFRSFSGGKLSMWYPHGGTGVRLLPPTASAKIEHAFVGLADSNINGNKGIRNKELLSYSTLSMNP
jgi:hypothetical protein